MRPTPDRTPATYARQPYTVACSCGLSLAAVGSTMAAGLVAAHNRECRAVPGYRVPGVRHRPLRAGAYAQPIEGV